MENYLSELFERDLLKLKDEINNFKDENNSWRAADGITNPAGTLVLHLLGNLNYTIGTLIGGTGYLRNREQEFSLKGVPREKLVADIESTIEVFKTSLAGINQSKLDETYPLEKIWGQKSTAFYLTSFFGHFSYHLGQVNYLRRILAKFRASIPPLYPRWHTYAFLFSAIHCQRVRICTSHFKDFGYGAYPGNLYRPLAAHRLPALQKLRSRSVQ